MCEVWAEEGHPGASGPSAHFKKFADLINRFHLHGHVLFHTGFPNLPLPTFGAGSCFVSGGCPAPRRILAAPVALSPPVCYPSGVAPPRCATTSTPRHCQCPLGGKIAPSSEPLVLACAAFSNFCKLVDSLLKLSNRTLNLNFWGHLGGSAVEIFCLWLRV